MKTMMSKCLPFALMCLMFLLSTNSVFAQQEKEYTVQQGETLYSISKKLEVTIAELKQWNNINDNEIFIGQKLIYFTRSENEQQAQATKQQSLISNRQPESQNVYYSVKSGDNLFAISRAYNMSVEELKALNNLESDNIRVGQQLVVRKESAGPTVAVTSDSSPQGQFSVYTIQQGESMKSLLEKFKMSEKVFRELNPQINVNSIYAGQQATVLMPPVRNFANPYLEKANLQDLGEVQAKKYSVNEKASTTTNGELYNPDALTAAHSNIALGTILFVENPATGKGIYVRVNDRITGDGIKLSRRAFESLGLKENESAAVNIYMES